jgi:hypothetical protein
MLLISCSSISCADFHGASFSVVSEEYHGAETASCVLDADFDVDVVNADADLLLLP